MRRWLIAAVLLFAAAPLFAQFRVFDLVPRGAAPGGLVPIHLVNNDIHLDEFAKVSVTFGDLPAKVVSVSRSEIVVLAPPHGPGYVDVNVRVDEMSLWAKTFFNYGQSERVLLPVMADGAAGANGSRWASEAWVYNDSDHAVAIDPEYCAILPVGYFPCPAPARHVPAQASMRVTGDGTSWGYVYPPVEDVDSLHFSLHVRDLAHPELPPVEIPAIRDRDFRSGRVVLPGVPTSSGYRTNLRVFSGASTVTVTIADSTTGAAIDARSISRNIPTDSDPVALINFRDLFDTPQARAHDRVDVIIDTLGYGYDRYWALLTLTDNVTQQVTTYMPR